MDRSSCATLHAEVNEPSPGPVRAHELACTWLCRRFHRLLGRLQARDVALSDPCASYRQIRPVVGRISADAGWRQLQYRGAQREGGASDRRREGAFGVTVTQVIP